MPSAAHSHRRDLIKPWFDALESLGEYIGIRFGRVPPNSKEVDWVYFPHSEFDGIGAFGHLLREAGYPLEKLPESSHEAPPSWKPLVRALPRILGPRHRLRWRKLPTAEALADPNQPAPAVAWHVFPEEETSELLKLSRRSGVTLNTLLLKHLDNALRPDLSEPSSTVPWMIPVNLRGEARRNRDTQNHTSYIAITIKPTDRLRELHTTIYRALELGEHWAAWKSFSATRFLPRPLKRLAIKTDRAVMQWNIGAFSNLGVWDSEGLNQQPDLAGSWLFCPPVLRGQMVGAGCLTFQNRLSLVIQAHPDLTTLPKVPATWMNRWLDSLKTAAVSSGADTSPPPRTSIPAEL